MRMRIRTRKDRKDYNDKYNKYLREYEDFARVSNATLPPARQKDDILEIPLRLRSKSTLIEPPLYINIDEGVVSRNNTVNNDRYRLRYDSDKGAYYYIDEFNKLRYLDEYTEELSEIAAKNAAYEEKREKMLKKWHNSKEYEKLLEKQRGERESVKKPTIRDPLYAAENPSPTGPYMESGGKKSESGQLIGHAPARAPLWNTPKSDKKVSKQEQELRELYLYKPVDANVKAAQPDFSTLKSIIGDNYDEIKLDEEYKDLEYKPYSEKKDGYFWEKNKAEAKPKTLRASTGNTLKSIITNLKDLDSQGEDLEEMSYQDYYKLVNNGKEPPKQALIFRVLGNTINKLKENTVSKEIINYDANKHDCSDILSLAEYLANILIDLKKQKEA